MNNRIDQSEKVSWIECWLKEYAHNFQNIFFRLDMKSEVDHKHKAADVEDLLRKGVGYVAEEDSTSTRIINNARINNAIFY